MRFYVRFSFTPHQFVVLSVLVPFFLFLCASFVLSRFFFFFFFFFSSRRRHTRFDCDWSSDVCSSDLALSRSLFSHMIPHGQEAEYFSLYEISERGTSWLGPLIFGLTLQLTGSYRRDRKSVV